MSVLLVMSCSGLGVVLQRVFHVVEQPVTVPADLPAQMPVPRQPPNEPALDLDPSESDPPDPPVRPRPAEAASARGPAPRTGSPVPPPVPGPAPETSAASDPIPSDAAGGEEPAATASITGAGDAKQIRVRGQDFDQVLPAVVPVGSYEILVEFDGAEPFVATTLVVLDGRPQVVTCRSALGICRVR